VDAAQLGAVGTIVVGLAAALAAVIGQRGANRASQSGAVLGGYSTLVDNLQEERNKLGDKLAENERLLAAAYRELADTRTEKADLLTQITTLTDENRQLRERIAELGGQPT
jgi:chromosome segregation ATPase